jgi:hypothetical protein
MSTECLEDRALLSNGQVVIFHSNPEVCPCTYRPIFPKHAEDFARLLSKAGIRWDIIQRECARQNPKESEGFEGILWHRTAEEAAFELVVHRSLFDASVTNELEAFLARLVDHLGEQASLHAWMSKAQRLLTEPLFPMDDNSFIEGVPVFNHRRAFESIGAAVVEVQQTVDRIAGPCPLMFHATSHGNAMSIALDGIDSTRHNRLCDFGRAFYMTPQQEQALEWAFARFPDAPALLVYRDILPTAPSPGYVVFDEADERWNRTVSYFRRGAWPKAVEYELPDGCETVFGPRATFGDGGLRQCASYVQLALKSERETSRWNYALLAIFFLTA